MNYAKIEERVYYPYLQIPHTRQKGEESMKIIYILVILSSMTISTFAQSNKPITTSAQMLYTLGEVCKRVEVDTKSFKADKHFGKACHIHMVKSDNFGDFPTYSGYHFKQILAYYPDSDFSDKAAYALIYLIDQEVYNFDDVRQEMRKLEKFIQAYPQSTLRLRAQKRIAKIKTDLKNGISPILD